MIYYCSNCNYTVEINDKEIAIGNVKPHEICPNCKSHNVSLNKESGCNAKTICWWILGAPAIGAIPFELIAEIFDSESGAYDFFMFLGLIGWILAGLAPKFIKKKINTNRYIEVKTAIKSKDYNTANQILSGILSLNPYDAEAYIERGKIRLELKKIALAIDDFIVATLLKPNNLDYAYYRVVALTYCMDDELLNTAIKKFSRLISNGYTRAECFNSRGECYLQLGYFDKALADFEKAIKINPSEEKYKKNKHLVQSKMHDDNQNFDIPTDTNDSNIVINLSTCTKEDLLELSVFNEERADRFLTDRESGKYYYDLDSLAQELNLQPHEILELENKLVFPAKQANKYARKVDI